MKKHADITVVLDRSGSMEVIKSATIEGLNSFIRNQQSDEFRTFLSLVQFDDIYESLYENKDIKQVKFLTHDTYQPRGTTALLDAVGITLKLTKKRIKKISSKPDHVLIVIITDGEENASSKFNRPEIFKMINKREEKDGWKFVFLAANQDAIQEGGNFGIKPDRALTFAHDSEGVKAAINSVSENIIDMMICDYNDDCPGFFDDSDREKQDRP